MIKKVEKKWGFEEWWINEPEYCFKVLILKPGYHSSRHFHKVKKETFLVLKGACRLIVGEVDHVLKAEQQITIQPGQEHEFYLSGAEKEPCVIYEISMYHDEADVFRLYESGPLV